MSRHVVRRTKGNRLRAVAPRRFITRQRARIHSAQTLYRPTQRAKPSSKQPQRTRATLTTISKSPLVRSQRHRSPASSSRLGFFAASLPRFFPNQLKREKGPRTRKHPEPQEGVYLPAGNQFHRFSIPRIYLECKPPAEIFPPIGAFP